MRLRLLLDENLSPRLKVALQRLTSSVDIARVGDEGAPPLGTSDPDLLLFLERAQRLLVTDNRSSIPDHVADHFAAGRHHWGIFEIRPGATMREVLESLVLAVEASEADEWRDQLRWIPF